MDFKNFLDFIRKKTERRSISILCIATGIIYIWFGSLKFFPESSPAEAIVSETLEFISMGLLKGRIPVFVLGLIEIGTGLGLILKKLKHTVPILSLQMIGTVLQLFLFQRRHGNYFR